MPKQLTLARLCNTSFDELYFRLFQNEELSAVEIRKLFSICVVFINSEDEAVQRLGYRALLLTCNKIKYYEPLYEVAANLGFTPIVNALVSTKDNCTTNIWLELNAAYSEQFHKDGIYKSEQQKEMGDFFSKHNSSSLVIIAPTSYGKTDLILTVLRDNPNSNICVITPTKALLAQTKMRIMREKLSWIKKIITTPEMYIGTEQNIVAVLTQERLLRLLKANKSLFFDYVIVDEAHNLLNNDDRSRLLASVLIILQKRKSSLSIKYLTPFLVDAANIDIRNTDIKSSYYRITEYMKTEKFYIYHCASGENSPSLVFYDQFLDKFWKIAPIHYFDDIHFILDRSLSKNIIYLNKPKDIEEFSYRFAHSLDTCINSRIRRALENITELIHPQYSLLSCLEKGVIYHHGSVPDSIRIYIEHLYTVIPEMKYVVTSSTLLEGVNLPAERMFILDNKKGRKCLSPSSFRNLVGRVSRFGDVFGKKPFDLNGLTPEIYLVVGKYYSRNANAENHLQRSIKQGLVSNDNVENILLKNKPITTSDDSNLYKKTVEFIENYEEGTIASFSERKVSTAFGKSCFANNLLDFDVFTYEKQLQNDVNVLISTKKQISDVESLFEHLYLFFFNKIQTSDVYKRFEHIETRNFYKMFLGWRVANTSYKQMIASFLGHWDKLIRTGDDTLVYVGRWGDTTRNGRLEYWTDISKKSLPEKINLAIVRIKDEQDFLDNMILRYIEVLNDFGLITESFYRKIKYGTDDNLTISLVKNGLSISLANLLTDKYSSLIRYCLTDDTLTYDGTLIELMKRNRENDILIFEAEYYMA